MAKFGEGDKRWIVEERPDGANVHNWHWAEKDCLEWSRALLSKLLSNLVILDGEGGLFVRTSKVDKVEGEAYVNIRKGKVIPGYEICLVLSWTGEAKDSEGKTLAAVDGTAELPYIADENADEDPEVRVVVRDEGPVGRRLKEAFVSKGKPLILQKVRTYVEVMSKGGPAKDELEVKDTKKPAAANDKKSLPASSVTAATAKTEAKERNKAKKEKEGFKTITVTETFSCRARDLFEILMDENRWKGFTQSNAKISKVVGGEFSIFDGSVTGTNVELQEAKLIVQKWRFGSWPDGLFSTVRLVFDEPEPGVTVLKLTHSEVPEEDRYGNSTVVENTERGWRDLIFHKIRAVFGFGL